jgi:hypothetical protein
MLFEGACEQGHPLMCEMRYGRVTGAVVERQVMGALVQRVRRQTCPECGAAVVEPQAFAGDEAASKES